MGAYYDVAELSEVGAAVGADRLEYTLKGCFYSVPRYVPPPAVVVPPSHTRRDRIAKEIYETEVRVWGEKEVAMVSRVWGKGGGLVECASFWVSFSSAR